MSRTCFQRAARRLARAATSAVLAGVLAAVAAPAHAFCGFYVSQDDGPLINEASQVVMARDGDQTVLTMINDYKGAAENFAMVIPTPTVLARDQIRISDDALVAHLDAYTTPRVVEYHDHDPCQPVMAYTTSMADGALLSAMPVPMATGERSRALGVTIEAEYTVGEYDILILSALESDGLQIWLDENGYKTPEAARDVLASYIAQDMKFFVAKVNLAAQRREGLQTLRPLQIAFESRKFMLPIRLGTVNAAGKQDLLLYTLTRKGRVEAANYPTRRIPSDIEVPLFVQKEFKTVYGEIFDRLVEEEGGRSVFTEYAWDMSWCDPCAADPLSVAQLRDLGVSWLGDGQDSARGVDVFVTRLHVRYDAETFPEDLRLHETADRRTFQGRYVTRRPYAGEARCLQGGIYAAELRLRFAESSATLARLTGRDIADIRARQAAHGEDPKALSHLGPILTPQ